MKTLKRTKVETTTTVVYEISAEDIKKAFGLPDDAELIVRVPGGGDWSNEDLDLDIRPVVATVKTASVEEMEE